MKAKARQLTNVTVTLDEDTLARARVKAAEKNESLSRYVGEMLRDLVNATIGFEGLSAEIRKPSKSLHRMLAARGNPSTENFFGIVKALQKKTRTRLRVAVQSS